MSKNADALKKEEVNATENVAENVTVNPSDNPVDNPADNAVDNKGDEKKAGNNTSNKPFAVGDDGLVKVVSVKRAGKSVVGTTGDIVTFDANGVARVKPEDALHFAKVPGFSFE